MKIKNSSKLTMLLATILVAGTSNAKQISVKVLNNTSYPIRFAIVCANKASDFPWKSKVEKVDAKQSKSMNIETDYKSCNLKVQVFEDDKGNYRSLLTGVKINKDNTFFKVNQTIQNTEYGNRLKYYISEDQEPIPTEPIELSPETK